MISFNKQDTSMCPFLYKHKEIPTVHIYKTVYRNIVER